MSFRFHPTATALLALTLAACAGGDEPAAPPRLVVLVVVDQMRADFVDRLRPHVTGGFRRLLDEGAYFPNAAYPYLATFTCPGHATIGTGTVPATHGIPENDWYERETGRVVACADDPDVRPVPYYGDERAGAGSSPHRLLAPTLAGVLRRERGARVVSLGLKARSAIMLAGPEADAVTWLSARLEGWETSTAYANAPLPAVQAFVDANPIDADRGRSWTRLLPESAYEGADDAPGESPPRGWTATFPHVLDGGAEEDNRFALQWERSPYADAYLGRFAAALAGAYGLGADARVDVLAVAFSTPDLVGHRFGPRSHEVQDVLLRLDVTLGRLFDDLDTLVGRGRYVVALSSDHGVAEVPEQLQAAGLPGRSVPAAEIADLVEQAARAAAGGANHVARVTGNDVYFEPGMFEKLAGAGGLDRVIQALEATPEIARVFDAAELLEGRNAADAEVRAAALSYVRGRSGDLVLMTAPGSWIRTSELATTHGTVHDYDRQVPLMLMGAGIRAGRYEQAASPADIAPTVAALAGVTLPRADGRVLVEALADAAH